MITEYNVAIIRDLNNKNNLEVEVSPDKDFVVFHFGEDKKLSAVVDKKDLYSLIFQVADEETQVDLMPTRAIEVKKLTKVHRVKVTKVVKPGEYISVHCETDVPTTIIDGFHGWLNKKKLLTN